MPWEAAAWLRAWIHRVGALAQAWESRLTPLRRISETLWRARGGSWLDWIFAAPTVVMDLGQAASPRSGYTDINRWMGEPNYGTRRLRANSNRPEILLALQASVLRYKDLVPEWIPTGGDQRERSQYDISTRGTLLVWDMNHPVRPVALYACGWGDVMVWDLRGFEGANKTREDATLVEGVWLTAQGADDRVAEAERVLDGSSVELRPLRRPRAVAVGADLERLADRVARSDCTNGRCVLLYGPSGAGKSSAARALAAARYTGERPVRILNVRGGDAQEAVRTCNPDVIVIDDITFEQSHAVLRQLEDVRLPNILVIVTLMDTERLAAALADQRGALHFPGIRPGRVDDVFILNYPDAQKRDAIFRVWEAELGLTLPNDLRARAVADTDGLTGAYIQNLLERLAAHGLDAYETELRAMLLLAPPKGVE